MLIVMTVFYHLTLEKKILEPTEKENPKFLAKVERQKGGDEID